MYYQLRKELQMTYTTSNPNATIKSHSFKVVDCENNPAGTMIIEETADRFRIKRRRIAFGTIMVNKLDSLPKPSNNWRDAFFKVECYECENDFTMTDSEGKSPIDRRLQS